MQAVPPEPAQRWLAVGNLVNMVGTGATMSSLVVFLAQVKHLSLTQAAAVLAAAGLLGVFGAMPVGQYSDRFGARDVAVVTELVCAAATACLLAVGSVWPCAVCLAVRQLATSGNTAARATLMGKLVPPDRRTALRAYQRTVTNVGFSVGAAVAATAMVTGGSAALYGLLLLDAATFCFSAFATAKLPAVGRGSRGRGYALDVLGDRGYVAVAVLNGLHTLNRAVVSVGLPLWIVYVSGLPPWAAPVAMIFNTAAVIGLQIPLSRRGADIPGARRSFVLAGVLTAGGCGALAVGGATATWLMLGVACTALVLGEILGAAAGWTLSYDLAPDEFLGQYQGLWQLVADASSKVAGPALIGWAIAAGPIGWSAVAAGFVALAVGSPPVVSRAAGRARPLPAS